MRLDQELYDMVLVARLWSSGNAMYSKPEDTLTAFATYRKMILSMMSLG